MVSESLKRACKKLAKDDKTLTKLAKDFLEYDDKHKKSKKDEQK